MVGVTGFEPATPTSRRILSARIRLEVGPGNEAVEPRHAVPKWPNRFARERKGSVAEGAGTDHFVRKQARPGEGDENDPGRVGRPRYSTPAGGHPVGCNRNPMLQGGDDFPHLRGMPLSQRLPCGHRPTAQRP